MKTAVVAIGGNAILRSGEDGTIENQRKNVEETARCLVNLIAEGYEIVLTHGNGPQVGAILIQNEEAKDSVPEMPLDVCGAETQGQLGYLLQQAFMNELRKRKLGHVPVAVVTQVVVDRDDPAFENPTKYIGPYYTKKEKDILERGGWDMKEDPRGGYRRVVPSPTPIDILEKDAIQKLIFGDNHYIVIAAGGGGIPVVKTNRGYKGVEAVIDKDLATAVLASLIGEKLLIILTDVPRVCTGYGTEAEKPLKKIVLEEANKLLEQGEFPPGSMGPKIEAASYFLTHGGEKVIITSPETIVDAIVGKEGTWIVK